jgi:hypothetical protein
MIEIRLWLMAEIFSSVNVCCVVSNKHHRVMLFLPRKIVHKAQGLARVEWREDKQDLG